MQITYFGEGKFRIKTKNGTQINTGDATKIGNFEINSDGEFDVAGIRAQSFGKILLLNVDQFSIAYLDKRKTLLTQSELEKLGDIDILMLPIGGEDVLNPKEAWNVAKAIEPKMIIPMHYKDTEEFTKIEGVTPEKLDELKIKKDLLGEDTNRVVILNARS